LGRWWVESKANKSKIGEEHSQGEGEKQKPWMLSGEVRDSPFRLPRFIDPREPRSRKLHAPRTLNAGNAVRR
jgi:hypothetical protein